MSAVTAEVVRSGPKEAPVADDTYGLVFVGTGVSTAIPVIGHISGNCACGDAVANPEGPNRRNNVSMLIRRAGSNVLIDAGKTFRDAYFRTLFPRNVARIDAVLLTHDHADAIFGLDDLRDFQVFRKVGMGWVCEAPLPVYLTQATLQCVSKGFDYIVNNSFRAGLAHEPVTDAVVEVAIERRAACFRLREVDDQAVRQLFFEPHVMPGLPFFTVPVFHGGTYRCLGFAFGEGCAVPLQSDSLGPLPDRVTAAPNAAGPCVLYLSDVSAVPSDVMEQLLRMSPIDVLVIDMLLPTEKHFSHFSIDDAWELILSLQPRTAFGVGMYCDIEHSATNQALRQRLADYRASPAGMASRIESVSLAFDGMEVPL